MSDSHRIRRIITKAGLTAAVAGTALMITPAANAAAQPISRHAEGMNSVLALQALSDQSDGMFKPPPEPSSCSGICC